MTADAAPRQVPSPTELRAAADRLVSALAAHSDPEYRLTVLKRLVRRLGEERYPLFLRLLGVGAESDDARAQRLLAETFGTALRRMEIGRESGRGSVCPYVYILGVEVQLTKKNYKSQTVHTKS